MDHTQKPPVSYADSMKSFQDTNTAPARQETRTPPTTRPIAPKKSEGLTIAKKKKTIRPTMNIDLQPIVNGIGIKIGGEDLPIDIKLSEEFPALLNKANELNLFSNKHLNSSELARILMAIGVTFVNHHIEK